MRSSRLRIPVDSNVERNSLNKNRNQTVANITSFRSRITDAIADTLIGGTITADTALVGTIQVTNIGADSTETENLTVSNTASIANIQVDALQVELAEAEDLTVSNTASILNIQADSTETETLTVNNTASIADIQAGTIGAETLTISSIATIADAQVSTMAVANTMTASDVVSDSVRIGNARIVQEGSQLFDMVLPSENGQAGQAMILDGSGVLSFAFPFILSNVVRVDKNGNDATGARNGNPKLTIASAISACQPGDIILVSPGMYNESDLTLPSDVTLVGLGRNATRIGPISPSTDTTIVTMGSGTAIENVTLTIDSTSHATFKGIAIPGTAASSCCIHNVSIRIDNSGASSIGTSNVYGIHSTGTGIATIDQIAVKNSIVRISSNGSGSKVGILCDTAQHTINIAGCAVSVTNSGSGEAAALQTNFTGTIARAFNSTLSGGTKDVLQSLGSIVLSGCTLFNRTVGTVSPTILTPTSYLVFGFSGSLSASSTRYLYLGSNASSANEIRVAIIVPTLVYAASTTTRFTSGPGNTTTFTIRKNYVDTSMTLALVGTSISASTTANPIQLAAGDVLSVKAVTGLQTQIADCFVVLYCY